VCVYQTTIFSLETKVTTKKERSEGGRGDKDSKKKDIFDVEIGRQYI
jgi:hypothetical protein